MYTTKGAFTCKSKFIVHAYVQTNIADNKMNQSRMIARKSYESLIPKHTHFYLFILCMDSLTVTMLW